MARPFGWTDGAPPLIYVAPEKRSRAAFTLRGNGCWRG